MEPMSTQPEPQQKKSWVAYLQHPIIFLLIRLAVGGVFVLFGFAKAIAPIAEFASVIKTYDMLPEVIVPAAAVIFIVTEIVFGVFFLTGVFTTRAAQGLFLLLISFMIALSQAMLRGIELEDCGCSGGLFSIGETPQSVLLRDLIMFGALSWFLKAPAAATQRLTIDQWLKKS